jgi:hypothetical protein
MRVAFGEPDDFLAVFQSRGFFLDDLVLKPINQIKDKLLREEHRLAAVNDFAQWIKEYEPAAIVVVMDAIAPSVQGAMRQSGFGSLPFYAAPFPIGRNYWPFVGTIQAVLAKLPAH